jgi:hypothetical protein
VAEATDAEMPRIVVHETKELHGMTLDTMESETRLHV